jgi:hypothetical protein
MSGLKVRSIESRRDIEKFIRVPWSLYADDPQWVPPLRAELRSRLLPSKNPYFEHAEVAYFVGERNGHTVGRISAQVCGLAQEYQGRGTGHFGLFECEDCQETADGLFHAAEDWLRGRGMTRLMGPFNLSINDEMGLLVEGFHRPPSVFMGHHRPYYESLIRGSGLHREKDAYAYYLDITRPYPDRIQRILRVVERDRRIRVRPMDRKNIHRELEVMLEIFNEAWVKNWGYVPFTSAEVEHLERMVRHLIGADSVLLTEVNGEVAGFVVLLPNLNELIRDLNGKLFPAGWFRLLWRMKFARCSSVRVPLMGLREQYHRSHTGAAIAFLMIDRCRQVSLPKGVTHCEMSWILEDNLPMRGILDALNSTRDKVYRIFSKLL